MNMNKKNEVGNNPNQEKSTNISALVFLVFATFILVVITLSMASPAKEESAVVTTHPGQTANLTTLTTDQLDGFPDSLPTPDQVQLQENSRNDFGPDKLQRVLIFHTDQPLSALFDQYRSWATAHNFTIRTADQQTANASLVASHRRGQVVVAISEVKGNRRVEVNYVKI